MPFSYFCLGALGYHVFKVVKILSKFKREVSQDRQQEINLGLYLKFCLLF